MSDKLPDDQQEDGEDVAQSKQSSAVITATDWTVETILEQLRKGNIELNPDFQRREAWKVKRKSQFIESLILGIPVPQIVLAERKNKRGSFIVIDGKQRLLTLRQFCSPDDTGAFRPFALTELGIRKDLEKVTYSKLSSDLAYDADYSGFENGTIRTAVIRNWPDENFLYTVFLRLNTGSVPLSPQELRQALHPGGFSKFVDDFSIDSQLLRQALGLSAPDFRMRDAELVIRFFAFKQFLPTYTGNLKPLLDATTAYYNSIWNDNKAEVIGRTRELELALQTTITIFGSEHAFRKWNGKSFERPLNRAVFDIMAMYFSRADIAEIALKKSEAVVSGFQNLCETDATFRASIEGTTKSIDAIGTRLNSWGKALRDILGIQFPVAEIRNDRVHLE
ncbi:MAG: DUF262 domain-containing protein [Ferrovibrio sp.]|uniref:DUF262 domain-containing protein n=1 Tax=Ferrovibrio sp. TaxID=1917215 RepID=UPI00391DFD40